MALHSSLKHILISHLVFHIFSYKHTIIVLNFPAAHFTLHTLLSNVLISICETTILRTLNLFALIGMTGTNSSASSLTSLYLLFMMLHFISGIHLRFMPSVTLFGIFEWSVEFYNVDKPPHTLKTDILLVL